MQLYELFTSPQQVSKCATINPFVIIPSFRRNLSSLLQQGPGPRVQVNSL